MRLTFLGTGTSMGIPVIGCRCGVCTSSDSRNKRLRTSALLEAAGLSILIDAGPDLRQQALAAGITRLDGVLLTHAHADHVAGLDDLRPLNFAQNGPIALYGNADTLAAIRERYSYAFQNSSEGSTRPALDLIEIASYVSFSIGPLNILPLDVQHGTWAITGFRIGRLGYITDASAIPAESREHLINLDVLVLNALRLKPHPTHFSLEESLAVVEELKPQRALFVHMTHDIDHATICTSLPKHVQLACDGQVIDLEE